MKKLDELQLEYEEVLKLYCSAYGYTTDRNIHVLARNIDDQIVAIEAERIRYNPTSTVIRCSRINAARRLEKQSRINHHVKARKSWRDSLMAT